jgi:mono/diheme cytochrome c family protein
MPPNDFINRQLSRVISDNSPTTLMGLRGLLRYNSIPTWLLYLIIVAIVGSWIPLAGAVRAKFVRSGKPPVHLFLDMDQQPRYEPQDVNPLFANNMAMRPPIAGVVKRGGLEQDDQLHLGYTITSNAGDTPQVQWVEGFPDGLTVDAAFLARGKELYARYCYLCHGYDGYGYGPVHVRTQQRPANNAGWAPPSNLNDQQRRERPNGHLYNTINNGIRTMAGYGHQIQAPEDRWAVVAYVRALQLSQNATPDMVPAELRDSAPVRPTMVGGAPFVPAPATQPGSETATQPAPPAAGAGQ